MNTNYAGFGKRLVASIVDGLILTIPMMVLGIGAGSAFLSLTTSVSSMGFLNLVMMLLSFGYFAYFESSEKQATPGKSMMNIKVADINGNRLTFGKAFLRNVMKIVSAMIIYIGFIMAAFTQKKQALHDMAVGAILLDDTQQKELNTTV